MKTIPSPDDDAGPVSSLASLSSTPLPRERLLKMLDNYANGIYQAILPEVVAEAARQLRASVPCTEEDDAT